MSRCTDSIKETSSIDPTPANVVPQMLLLPTRVFGRKNVDTQRTQASSTEWVGMKPCEWVELLASIVEQRERAFGEKKDLEPILQLKNVRLATYDLPVNVSKQQNCDCDEKQSSADLTLHPIPPEEDARSQEVKSDDAAAVTNNLTSYNSGPQNDGRSHTGCISSDDEIIPDDVTSSAVPSRKASVPVIRNRSMGLRHYYWDLSFLSAHDAQNMVMVNNVVVLVRQLESMPNVVHISACYCRIRQRFHRSFCWITKHYPSCGKMDNERSTHLRLLYKLTAQKLQALINMARLLVLKAEKRDLFHGFPPRRKSDGGKWKHLPTHMTAWLRDNWTNPYPDDEGLSDMARECGVSVSVVNNWLINARTRKWRPAIAKAYEMNRPVDLLYQDSMRIFDGLPLSDCSASQNKSSSVVPDKVESAKT